MRRFRFLPFALVIFSGLAHAEMFTCQGTGRFAVIENKSFELTWREQTQKILMDGHELKVLASLDKANSDGTHYLGIEVMEMKDGAVTALRGAKGSLKDMVQYVDGEPSMITCVPVGG